jgi:hypothetical protein
MKFEPSRTAEPSLSNRSKAVSTRADLWMTIEKRGWDGEIEYLEDVELNAIFLVNERHEIVGRL